MPSFQGQVLLEVRQRAGLTQRDLAKLAVEATQSADRDTMRGKRLAPDGEFDRRVRTWESRIGAWERAVDAPSASYVPTLARVLGIEPLAMFDVDQSSPPFTALRLARGLTLRSLADATGISYTSLYRMLRGVTELPDTAAEALAVAMGMPTEDLRAALARDM